MAEKTTAGKTLSEVKDINKIEYAQSLPTSETVQKRAKQPALEEHEKWLQSNNEARKLIERGLADLAAGRVVTGLSFVQYADDAIED